jgi:transposase InsO family protein
VTQPNQGRYAYLCYPNLLKSRQVVRPDQVWCAHITYIQFQRDFVYLAIVLDVFTRSLRGWHLGNCIECDREAIGMCEGARSGLFYLSRQ